MLLCLPVLVYLYCILIPARSICRGTPGVDWDLKAANKSAHSVVYYNTYDASQDPNAGLLANVIG